MALGRLTAFVLLVPALSEGSSLLQRSASRQRAFAGLRYSPQDPAARTLLTLDTNQDGRIDPNEVAAFARSQGLDAAAATQEFSSIDTNGDGTLDSSELQKVLATGPATELTSTEVAQVEAPAAPQAAAVKLRPAATEEEVAVEAPVTAAAPAQQPSLAEDATPAKHVEVAPPIPLAEVAAPAQHTELKTVDMDTLSSVRSADAGNVELISDESRNSIRMAAQQVAEELQLEENEEREARDFDRRAAEVRANSTALAKLTVQDALDAGTKAAHVKADELMAEITKLEEQAERAEVRAAALRAKSKMELEEGNQLMAAAEEALKQSPDRSL